MMQSYRLSVSTSVKGPLMAQQATHRACCQPKQLTHRAPAYHGSPPHPTSPHLFHSSQFPLNVCARPQGQHSVYSIALLLVTLLLVQLNTIWPCYCVGSVIKKRKKHLHNDQWLNICQKLCLTHGTFLLGAREKHVPHSSV